MNSSDNRDNKNSEKQEYKNNQANSKTRTGNDFIPFSTSPDNWPFYGERSNPLCSKGATGDSSDYEDYKKQAKDEGMSDESYPM